ncbi:MAG: response regulator [Thermodesulfobacteriota bacterium]|nr:response regulator [Thermodesulfobacteriota bacterium]
MPKIQCIDAQFLVQKTAFEVMDGGETYGKLKEINPDIKVLLSSGYGINGKTTEILDLGCNGFIQKPFNMKILSKKI